MFLDPSQEEALYRHHKTQFRYISNSKISPYLPFPRNTTSKLSNLWLLKNKYYLSIKLIPTLKLSIKLTEFCQIIIFQNLCMTIITTGFPVNQYYVHIELTKIMIEVSKEYQLELLFFKYILLQHMSSNEILKDFSREIILINSYVYTHYFSYFIRMHSNHSF